MQSGETVLIPVVGIGALVEQRLDNIRLAHGAGDNQGRPSPVRNLEIRVRTGVEQGTGGLRIAPCGEHQRGGSAFRNGVDVGLILHQFLGNRGVAARYRPHQGSLCAIFFLRVGIRATLKQCVHRGDAAVAGRQHQRRFTGVQRRIGIGPCRQELLGHGRIRIGRGRIKRRCAVFVGGLQDLRRHPKEDRPSPRHCGTPPRSAQHRLGR